MDIKGNKVSFTPDEAHWAQNASARFGAMPDVAQRILDARTEYARPWFDSSEMPLISTAMRDIMSRVALNDSLANLHEATKRHITADEECEEHVITVEMDKNEKQRLLELARIHYEIAEEQLETPELTEVEDKATIDDFAMFAATSDLMEPDQAVALGDLLRDPEIRADAKAHQYEEAESEIHTTTAIISALEANLDKPQN